MTKVLVVEDTEVNRIVMSSRLEKLGFDVLLAEDGQQGVEKAEQEAPDIILLDMCLPIMDGDEVARTLKQNAQTQSIPIIAVTAHAITKTRDHTIDIGCDEYETKPVNFDRLVEKMNALIGNRP